MKKVISIPLAVLGALALSACGPTEGSAKPTADVSPTLAPAVPSPAVQTVDLSCASQGRPDKKVPLAAEYRVLKPGDTTTGGKKFDITVKEVTDPYTIGNEYIRKSVDAAGHRAVGLVLSVTNKTTEPQRLDQGIFSSAVDDDLNCAKVEAMGPLMDVEDPKMDAYLAEPLDKNLGAGKTTDLHLVYETGKDIKKLTLYFVTGSDTASEVFASVAL
ncbi:hypothetical protein [Streptomyces subrutilus]|uniref:DUF4352 domain-containing protein n=1 Tax=Streptomyces subrutilus TaxID=36818 RepID=A0A1E5PXU1_9ACTN|nr:hypothetical protein [Streptomyces subrutilus]OEJ34192.1 hypothetical protein BGK67_25195 [Streptomyces subrutilus]